MAKTDFGGKMTLGNKIRTLRLTKRLTQSEVAENIITRNMLSAIESDRALPSLDTLYQIAKRLDIPVAYLISDDEDITLYKKNELIGNIRKAFSEKNYDECISLIDEIGSVDDELAYIMAYSGFEIGVKMAKNGSFTKAEAYFNLALMHSCQTVYDTSLITCKIPLYMSFVKNVNAPLLEFDIEAFKLATEKAVEYEFFKYVSNDYDYHYKNEWFLRHINAKVKMKERKYYDAITILLEIAESKSVFEYNAYMMYNVYSDLDKCYKQVYDFENAYRYAEKRISLLEGFNS